MTDAELEEAYLANALVTLWQENWGVYGARKLWHAARRAGLDVGRDQVGPADADRRDHRRGPRQAPHRAPPGATRPRRGTRTWSSAAGTPRPAIDQLWVADFSYVWTLAGFVYVAFVVDVFSRRILGWRVTTTKHTGLVTDALRQALHDPPPRRITTGLQPG